MARGEVDFGFLLNKNEAPVYTVYLRTYLMGAMKAPLYFITMKRDPKRLLKSGSCLDVFSVRSLYRMVFQVKRNTYKGVLRKLVLIVEVTL